MARHPPALPLPQVSRLTIMAPCATVTTLAGPSRIRWRRSMRRRGSSCGTCAATCSSSPSCRRAQINGRSWQRWRRASRLRRWSCGNERIRRGGRSTTRAEAGATQWNRQKSISTARIYTSSSTADQGMILRRYAARWLSSRCLSGRRHQTSAAGSSVFAETSRPGSAPEGGTPIPTSTDDSFGAFSSKIYRSSNRIGVGKTRHNDRRRLRAAFFASALGVGPPWLSRGMADIKWSRCP